MLFSLGDNLGGGDGGGIILIELMGYYVIM